MSNFAAIIPAAKTPLVVKEVELYNPGPKELLIKNTVIAFNPIEYKIAKQGIFPLQYPAILGSSFGGTVEAIGSAITHFKIGDKVAVAKKFDAVGNQYAAYQKYVIADEKFASKVAEGVDVDIPVSLTGNLPTVLGLFTGRAGLDRPVVDGKAESNGKKVLVYGGSSSVGALGVQYTAQAGYTVITTSSPRNKAFVSKLGAAKVLDHTQSKDALIEALVAEGPFQLVVDTIATPDAIAITGPVVAAQGGGELYALLPAFGPETAPAGVTRIFDSWQNSLLEEKNKGLLEWALESYLPQGVKSGKIIPLPVEKVSGGLEGINGALDKLEKGVSGVKLILDPWA